MTTFIIGITPIMITNDRVFNNFKAEWAICSFRFEMVHFKRKFGLSIKLTASKIQGHSYIDGKRQNGTDLYL